MQIRGELGKLGASALLLPLLFFLRDLSVMVVQVAAHLIILGLHILQVLLARVEVVLPTAAIVTAIAINRKSNQMSEQLVCLSDGLTTVIVELV